MESLDLQAIFTTMGIGIYAVVVYGVLGYVAYDCITLFYRANNNQPVIPHSGRQFIKDLFARKPEIKFTANNDNNGEAKSAEKAESKPGFPEFLMLPMVIAIFCTGVLVENLTVYYKDLMEHQQNSVLSWLDRRIPLWGYPEGCNPYTVDFSKSFKLPKLEDLRFYTLFDGDDRTGYRPNPLGKIVMYYDSVFPEHLFKNSVLISYMDSLDTLQVHCDTCHFPSPDSAGYTFSRQADKKREKIKEALSKYASAVYYNAKNWSYKQDTYYNELADVERRCHFAYTLAWLNDLPLLLAAFLVLGGLGARLLVQTNRFSKARPVFVAYYKWQMLRLMLGFILLALVSWVSVHSYVYNYRDFLNRSYGYYISNIENQHILKKAGVVEEFKVFKKE